MRITVKYVSYEGGMGATGEYIESISLPSNLGIRNISSVFASITSELSSRQALTIDLPSDAEADLSFVQLIESARLSAKASGKSFCLSSPASGTILSVLRRGGFIEAFAAEDA